MLTKAVPSPSYDRDAELLKALGLRMREPFKHGRTHPAQETGCSVAG